jgi:transposase
MGAPKKADWREERRKRAWKLKEKGWQQKDIAVALGGSSGAVSQLLKRGRVGGIEALNAHPPKGMTPRLTVEQKAQIPVLLAKGAEAYGFRGDVWTASRVAQVIEQTFGIRYHRDHVGRLLTSPQAGVDSNPSSEPASARKKPSSSGPSSAGPPLKKSRAGQRHHRRGAMKPAFISCRWPCVPGRHEARHPSCEYR